MASNRPSIVDHIYDAIFLVTLINSLIAAGQQQAPVADKPLSIRIPNLPPSHYQFWLKNNPTALKGFEQLCAENDIQEVKDIRQFKRILTNFTFEDKTITTELSYGKKILNNVCSKINSIRKYCWGYEKNCDTIYLMPECSPSASRSQQDKRIDWFSQADFGYILDRRRELGKYCSPDKQSNNSFKSSLECTHQFKTCRGENLYIDFDSSQTNNNLHDGRITLRKRKIGGWNCDFQGKRIPEQGSQSGFLRSWFNELKEYDLMLHIDPAKACKERIHKQAYLIQLDSSANMYHYFCTFLNLYATMHLNNRFSEDNQLILWDHRLPNSPFEVMWSVFSKNQPMSLNELKGKQVCFDKFIFALPPRMVNGLYYNTPLIEGCSKSGLFDAFNKHVLHNLDINRYDSDEIDRSTIRVTIVSRSTETRKILNEHELKAAANSISAQFQTQIVDFANLTFRDQIDITHKTDILVGVHGAGLTHTLFLPDWASLFELYDCMDNCYRDLARLRGVSYFTLKNGENSGEKSKNFQVDVKNFVETLKLVSQEVMKRRGDLINEVTQDTIAPIESKFNEGLTKDAAGMKPIQRETNMKFTDMKKADPEPVRGEAVTEPTHYEADKRPTPRQAGTVPSKEEVVPEPSQKVADHSEKKVELRSKPTESKTATSELIKKEAKMKSDSDAKPKQRETNNGTIKMGAEMKSDSDKKPTQIETNVEPNKNKVDHKQIRNESKVEPNSDARPNQTKTHVKSRKEEVRVNSIKKEVETNLAEQKSSPNATQEGHIMNEVVAKLADAKFTKSKDGTRSPDVKADDQPTKNEPGEKSRMGETHTEL